MPQIAAKNLPPGGKRASAAEVAVRLSRVEALLAEGRSRSEIVEAMTSRGCAPRTVDDYIRRTRERWAAERAAAQPTERELTISRLSRLSRELERRGAWGPLIACERLLVDVRGLRVAHRTEPEVAAPTNTPSSPRRDQASADRMKNLSDEELETLGTILQKLDAV